MADISRAMDKQMQFLIYNTPEEQVSVDVIVKDETIWVTQRTMAELFGCSSDNISLHLKNIYASDELQENSTTEEFSVVRKEGSRNINRKVTFYNLDAIISVGYRVNSSKATKFR
ncbi:virulence RhuM family protein [uncultured Phascolarctobacterium sp.]|uniref:virulence RhuM family protein n=1 Tax=uncultured Phascolarctobacterium sp. TaxID=512296 RepID=UPI0025E4B6D9|nr:RhuM family protein [uncultured Phascolarctobacterium sp.]